MMNCEILVVDDEADSFRKIPEQVRSSIDSKQVGRYLDRVFEIIVECG